MMREQRKLGEILVDLGVLNPTAAEDVSEAQARRRDRPKYGQVARDMGLVREEHILAALAVQMELFPGIHAWSLNEILRSLLAADRPSA
jgi:hypothetical protein